MSAKRQQSLSPQDAQDGVLQDADKSSMSPTASKGMTPGRKGVAKKEKLRNLMGKPRPGEQQSMAGKTERH